MKERILDHLPEIFLDVSGMSFVLKQRAIEVLHAVKKSRSFFLIKDAEVKWLILRC